MILKPMYPGIAYSPLTELTEPLSATDTVIRVVNASDDVFPPAPNTAVLEHGASRETISYGGKDTNSLTFVTRATAQGETPRDWPAGTIIARVYTAGDQQAFIDNIHHLDNTKVSVEDFTDATHEAKEAMESAIATAVDGLASQNALESEINTLAQSITQRMPHAPQDGRVYGGVGPNWHALEGTEERAVITVSHTAQITQAQGVYHVDNWDDFEVITIEHNGAQANYFKGFSQNELYAVGTNGALMKFTFDPVLHTVAVDERTLSSGGTNPNILHNWDFRNPVNQRGQMRYMGSGAGNYTVDRWRAIGSTGSLSINNGYIEYASSAANARIEQIIEFPSLYAGKTVTCSVYARNPSGIPYWVQLFGTNIIQIPPDSAWDIYSTTITLPANITDIRFRIIRFEGTTPASIDVKSAKIEIGNASTLANDPPVDFGRELAICQRFYERIATVAITGLTTTQAFSATGVLGIVPYLVEKRARPVVSFSRVEDFIYTTGTHAANLHLSAIATVSGNITPRLFTLNGTVGPGRTITLGEAGRINMLAGAWIAFDADL